MGIETRYMRKPLTRDGGGDPAEFELLGNHTKPTAVTDSNVYPIPAVRASIDDVEAKGRGTPEETEEFHQLMLRTDNVASDCEVILWYHNWWTDEWYPSAVIEVKGETLLDSAHGGIFSIPGPLGCDYIGVQVTGHGAGDTLYITHLWS